MNRGKSSALHKLTAALDELNVPPPTYPRKGKPMIGKSNAKSIPAGTSVYDSEEEQGPIILVRRKSLEHIVGKR
jgi:hypothetical protein